MNQRFLLAAALVCAAATVQAQTAPVTADHAWARASVPGQTASGAYMTLTASEPLTLVGVATPVAGVAEVHEMKMEGEVMRMRPVQGGLPLAPGKPVQLKPGGYHVMMMQLKSPLKAGSQIPLTLRFRDAKGGEKTLELSVPVAATPPAGAMPMGGMHKP
jgi:copper(I)-binding protein